MASANAQAEGVGLEQLRAALELTWEGHRSSGCRALLRFSASATLAGVAGLFAVCDACGAFAMVA